MSPVFLILAGIALLYLVMSGKLTKIVAGMKGG